MELLTEEIREKTLKLAKTHKSSWIELGQHLFAIHKDKHYKEWGYLAFQTYCKKELGIKDTTASKLIKSYAFLEKEEPRMTQEDHFQNTTAEEKVPDYESVNLLRLAHNNSEIPASDLNEIREAVIEKGNEPKEVRAQVKQIIEANDTTDEAEKKNQLRNTKLRRLITMLSNTEKDLKSEKLVPQYLLQQMHDLVEKLEDQVEDV